MSKSLKKLAKFELSNQKIHKIKCLTKFCFSQRVILSHIFFKNQVSFLEILIQISYFMKCKKTYQPKTKQRRRSHGFLHLMKKHPDILKRKRLKGRWKLTVV